MRERLPIRFVTPYSHHIIIMTLRHHLSVSGSMLELLYVTSPHKQVTDVSLVLKNSDMDSENLSSLIRLSVSDDQKTDSTKVDTHYYNSNLIWHTVSRRVDEAISSDHPRREASRVIQWYVLIHDT